MFDIIKFLEANGVRNINQRGEEIGFSCPFHDDSSPSCSLNARTRVYNCFGCGAKGTLVDLVAKLKGYDSNIIQELKKRPQDYLSNIDLENFDIVQEVKKILRGIVNKKTVLDEKVLDQFRFMIPSMKIRVGNDELLRLFEIGYSKEHNRITLPIRNESGELMAVMGRARGSNFPKYMTLMPEKGIFEKSKHLYGLHLFRKKPTAFMIICEGHFDVIGFYKAGLECAVGVMGSFLSKEQKNLVLKNTDEVIIAMDNDEAGRRATDQIAGALRGMIRMSVFKYVVDKKDPGELSTEEILQGLSQSERIL